MSVHLKPAPLTSDEILKELVIDSLPHVLGESYEIITNNLPFDGNHILALDAHGQPSVITYDSRDGGRALLAGLAVIEGLADNRAMLYRLYPALFRGDHHQSAIFRIEEVRLILLSPTPPPGGVYLEQALRFITAYTFRALEVEGTFGLLIEPPRCRDRETASIHEPFAAAKPVFRSGECALSAEEERYFYEG